MRAVSVVIRTRNEASGLDRLLAALQRQTHRPEEVIVVDSGSCDATVSIARREETKVIEVDFADFSFGRTLNLGSAAARGEFLVYLSAHASPREANYLENLLSPFADPQAAGVYGRQCPWPDCNIFEAAAIEAAFACRTVHPEGDFFFSAANCAVRRGVWEQLPFNEELPGCEDQLWAKGALEAGYKIIYEPRAAVYHSHNEGLRGIYCRSRREAVGDRFNGRLHDLHNGGKKALLQEFRGRCREHISLAMGKRAPWLAPWGLLRCAAYSLGKYQGLKKAI